MGRKAGRSCCPVQGFRMLISQTVQNMAGLFLTESAMVASASYKTGCWHQEPSTTSLLSCFLRKRDIACLDSGQSLFVGKVASETREGGLG